jgi:raffinose/stachyose/melibiose transport system substrate-binding protein
MLAGCMPGTAPAAGSNTAGSSAVATDPARMGKVTLHVLDAFSGGTDNAWMRATVAAFQRRYPNITVKRTSLPWNDLMAALPLKLRSADAPDIVPPNNGWQSLGTLVRGGLVRNLDGYAKAYGWTRQFPQPIMRESEFTAGGRQMGTGSVFGAPVARASLIEAYYNRSLLRRIGAQVPRSYADFTADLAKAHAAGITPISLGNVDQSGITTPLYSAMNALGSQRSISDFIYSQGHTGIAQTGFPQAVSAMRQWSQKGYFGPGYAGTANQDAAQAFVDGKALFRFDYSGSLPLTTGRSAGFGSFVLPRADGGKPAATASSAAQFSIASKSKHPDAAAAFLNFAAGKQAAELAVQNGTMPLLHPDLSAPAGNPLLSDDVAVARQISADGTAVPYLDWSTPTLLTTIDTSMQSLLAGKTTASTVVAAADKDDSAFLKTLATR